MSPISGPYLEGLVEEVSQWYMEMVEFLVAALTEDHPYGSVSLTSEEQLTNFLAMKQEDWESLGAKLALRYRGHPDADERVQNELADFLTYMTALHQRLGGGYGGA